MPKLKIALLRGVCQTPAYAAHERGYFREEGLDVDVEIAATAWLVPHKLTTNECHFAVMPWTRVAAAEGLPFVLLAGSGFEEAAIVMRNGLAESEVRKVVIPLRGGIKDLTAMGLIRSLGWKDVEVLRQPSGDGAIIAFFGEGADAASMVEPYSTMMEAMNVGRVIRRTGDLWKGAPGCSLTTTAALAKREPDTVARIVRAYVRGAKFVNADPDAAATIAAKYIGINARFIRDAIHSHGPNVDAVRNTTAMNEIQRLMVDLGYVPSVTSGFLNLAFLDAAQAELG